MGPQFGVHRPTARLRRRDWPAKGAPNCLCPQALSCLQCVLRAGRKAGWPALRPFPCQRLEASKCSLAWLLRAGPGHQWSPGRRGGLSNKQSPAGPGPEAQAGEKLIPAGPGVPLTPSPRPDAGSGGSVDTGQVGRGERACANVAGRGGRREQTSREGRAVSSPSVQLTQQSQVTGLDGSTRARQTDRQTDVHTEAAWGAGSARAVGHGACPPVHPGGLPAQPRSPRPAQTTSHGECVGPTG